ncbi:hypothetical protein BCR34DRAFT_556178, partial [Clohesyomyces aquaticus]
MVPTETVQHGYSSRPVTAAFSGATWPTVNNGRPFEGQPQPPFGGYFAGGMSAHHALTPHPGPDSIPGATVPTEMAFVEQYPATWKSSSYQNFSTPNRFPSEPVTAPHEFYDINNEDKEGGQRGVEIDDAQPIQLKRPRFGFMKGLVKRFRSVQALV